MQQEAGQKHMKNMMQKTINIKMSRLQCSAAAILWSSHLLLLWWDPGPVYHPGVTRGVEWLGKLARHRTTAHNTKKQNKKQKKNKNTRTTRYHSPLGLPAAHSLFFTQLPVCLSACPHHQCLPNDFPAGQFVHLGLCPKPALAPPSLISTF